MCEFSSRWKCPVEASGVSSETVPTPRQVRSVTIPERFCSCRSHSPDISMLRLNLISGFPSLCKKKFLIIHWTSSIGLKSPRRLFREGEKKGLNEERVERGPIAPLLSVCFINRKVIELGRARDNGRKEMNLGEAVGGGGGHRARGSDKELGEEARRRHVTHRTISLWRSNSPPF